MQISPDGLAEFLVYFISSRSSSLNSTPTPGPPTWPAVLSYIFVPKEAPQDSVYPYASITGQQKTHLKNAKMFGAIGAEPVIIILTLPPRAVLTFENTIPSKTLLSTQP